MPKVEVRLKNLTVATAVKVGSRALPTLINATRDVFEVCLSFSVLNYYFICVYSKYLQILCSKENYNFSNKIYKILL